MYDGTQFQILATGSMVTLSTVQATIQAGAVIGTPAGGPPNALTMTLTPAITAYAYGQAFKFNAGGFPNTGATTVNINGLGTKDIFVNGTACVGGEIQANAAYEIFYDGTQFNLIGSSRASSAATATSATSATTAAFAGTLTSVVNSEVVGTTQAAFDNSTKIATTAYADRMRVQLGTRYTTTGGAAPQFSSSLPAGIKKATILFNGVSSNGTSPWLIRPEWASSTPTTGYTSLISPVAGSVASASSTAGFILMDAAVAANSYRGKVELFREGAAWICSVNISSDQTYVGNGSYTTNDDLTGITLTTDGGINTFDLMDINVQYEF
jgi:hypothetical protein